MEVKKIDNEPKPIDNERQPVTQLISLVILTFVATFCIMVFTQVIV
jgi:hypothetical protein